MLAERSENRVAPKKKDRNNVRSFFFGAATQIRTGDLILTKDVLYQLSHSSMPRGIPRDADYYIKRFIVCQYLFKIFR